MFDHPYAYFFQLPDGRIFFAIPYERDSTLIGTTDADHPGLLSDVCASVDEIAYLCDGASQYFAPQITPEDVIWSYSGVRPLVDEGAGKPEAATRGDRLELSGETGCAPLLSVYGGKITTYRQLAEVAVDLLAQRLGLFQSGSWTKTRALPGGDFPINALETLKSEIAARFVFLAPADVDRVARAYGTRAERWLGKARTWDDLGAAFGAGLTEAEVDYLRREEWAVTVEDIIWRRSKLGLRSNLDELGDAGRPSRFGHVSRRAQRLRSGLTRNLVKVPVDTRHPDFIISAICHLPPIGRR